MKILSSNIERFLGENPNASLREYFEYITNETNTKQQKKTNEEELLEDWLKSQDGKWFYIDFNGKSKAFIKFNYQYKKSNGNQRFEEYSLSIFDDGSTSYVRREKRGMNFYWIVNSLYPRLSEYNKATGSFLTNSNRLVKEVSAEYVEGLFRAYEGTIKEGFINAITKTISNI